MEFQEKSKFPRVKNVLNVEIKKIESEIADLKKASAQPPTSSAFIRRVIELNEFSVFYRGHEIDFVPS
jgi:hypothetical protein